MSVSSVFLLFLLFPYAAASRRAGCQEMTAGVRRGDDTVIVDPDKEEGLRCQTEAPPAIKFTLLHEKQPDGVLYIR